MKKYAENILLVCSVLVLSSLAASAAPVRTPLVTPEPSTILGLGVPVVMIGIGKLRSMLKK